MRQSGLDLGHSGIKTPFKVYSLIEFGDIAKQFFLYTLFADIE